MTVSDQALDRRLRSLQEDGPGPVVSHYIYARRPPLRWSLSQFMSGPNA
jgi:hypothetical protein